MLFKRSLFAVFAVAGAVAVSSAVASGPASGHRIPPAPLSAEAVARLTADPAALRELTHPSRLVPASSSETSPSSHWQRVHHDSLADPGAMLLLTDGSVLIQDASSCDCGSGDWWRLTPDLSGNYRNGTLTQAASMSADYAPLYFASAVLPDGRVIVEGGEYNFGQLAWTNQGAIYDPVADSWTAVAPPHGGTGSWGRIGDAPAVVRAGGRFMVGAALSKAEAVFNASTLGWKDTGTGKADGNGEEGWSLLPDGRVLTVDTGLPPHTEAYDPGSGAWQSAGDTPQSLVFRGEIGPEVDLHDGSVLAVGATGANARYSSSTQSWSAAPPFPVIDGQQYDEADGPAAVLPNGKVLLMASPGEFQKPSRFFIYNGTKLTVTEGTPNQDHLSSYFGYMLVLPTGQVLFNDRVGGLWLYNSDGVPKARFAPVIRTVPTTLARGQTYELRGRQLSGLTQGAAYGDDYESATNYPLVRIVNDATGHVFYARTFDFTDTSVQPGAPGATQFVVPVGAETGASTLYVVASGLASGGRSVTVE